MSRYYVCTEVNQYCPVEATTLGYYPNVGVNAFLAAAFGVISVVTATVGIWKKTYSYAGFITAGCALELAGESFHVGGCSPGPAGYPGAPRADTGEDGVAGMPNDAPAGFVLEDIWTTDR